MSIKIKDLPTEERPREKLLTLGAKALSNTELLAVLLTFWYKEKICNGYSSRIISEV